MVVILDSNGSTPQTVLHGARLDEWTVRMVEAILGSGVPPEEIASVLGRHLRPETRALIEYADRPTTPPSQSEFFTEAVDPTPINNVATPSPTINEPPPVVVPTEPEEEIATTAFTAVSVVPERGGGRRGKAVNVAAILAEAKQRETGTVKMRP